MAAYLLWTRGEVALAEASALSEGTSISKLVDAELAASTR